MNIERLMNALKEKQQKGGKNLKNFKKSDWAVIGLVGVLLLVIAIPTEKNASEDVAKGSVSEQTAEKEDLKAQYDAGDYSQTASEEMSEEAYVDYLEKKMEKVLGQMDGVGDVEVMITVSDRGEYVVEKDESNVQTVTTEEDSAGGSRSVSESTKEEQTIYVETEDETYPYIQKEKLPTVEGVVVVAEGAGSSVVVSDISESVKALLPVEAHRIKVVKMCSKEE